MNINESRPLLPVRYIPGHAMGDPNHPDCEDGVISSRNDKYIFVRFNKQIEKLGFDGATSQACDPNDLIILPR